MQYQVEINVMPLKELLDPQGKAVEQSLNNLSIPTSNVRVGKRIELKVEAASKEDAFELVENACKKLLYNPVMEFYKINISEI
ncbi:MAG: phosphoribosylformylglycinamidine synthase subunit PurS [Bacteroidetes bacterium]|nr:phosphoribosylformylglycinamidine synthase subunit PurS [Bacteroidota bacterium]MCB0513024.1 phosphoribosylformylglycinamidine synthase subunit PurS [Bacteroidota bacterium]